MTYTIPTQALSSDHAANLAHFLTLNTGSCHGRWKGQMKANDQRALFGRFLGKGMLIIDGDVEQIKMVVSVCFGQDWDVRFRSTWAEI
jgi:hypothetical protein